MILRFFDSAQNDNVVDSYDAFIPRMNALHAHAIDSLRSAQNDKEKAVNKNRRFFSHCERVAFCPVREPLLRPSRRI